MTRILRRIVFWSLLAVFIASSVFWIFYVPYDSRAVLRAIPSNAAYVSVHENLAGRWNDVSASPLLRSLAWGAGISATNLDATLADRETIKWIDKLAGRQVAIAYLPSLGDTHCEGWLFSAWIGGFSQRLRWYASLGWVEELKQSGSYAKQRLWSMRLPGMRGNMKISVAISEGVIMGCVSQIPQGVRFMIESFDGLKPDSMAAAGAQAADSSLFWKGTASDRGWVNYEGVPPFCFELPVLRGSNAQGRIVIPAGMSSNSALLSVTQFQDLGQFLGDTPEIICLSRLGNARRILAMPEIPAEARSVADMVMKDLGGKHDGNMFVCMFGGKYRGRMKSLLPGGLGDEIGGIPVPSVMVGLEMSNTNQAYDVVSATLDRLNSEYKLGLIPRPVVVGNETVISFEGTSQNKYSTFRSEERVCYFAFHRWLILSSNLDSLSKIVARFQREEAAKEAASARWMKRLADDERTAVFFWTDMAAAGTTIRDALALGKISLGFNQSPQVRKSRKMLSFAMDWFDLLRQLGPCSISVEPGRETMEVRVRQGDPPSTSSQSL